jgi:hypothetical protein
MLEDMTPAELAGRVAADLGADYSAAVSQPLSPGEATRALGLTEAMAVGSFLASAAQLVVQIWQARQDRALLVLALAEGLDGRPELASKLMPERRLGLIARLLDRYLPASFGRLADRAGEKANADKRRWIADYLATRRQGGGPPAGKGETRAFVGGATILVPFADQQWWTVYEPIGWVPDAADGPGVTRADVPKGFVTDLASVPSYLWAVLQKTGRHGNAAIYHDWLYWEQSAPRAVADRVFDRAMFDMGVDATTRKLMWAGVRVFGGDYWDDNSALKAAGEQRVLKRLPPRPDITWEAWRREPGVFA